MKKTLGSSKTNASTMIFAAIFIALFTLSAGSYMTVISSSSAGTARIAEQQKAYYAAEAGAFRLLSEINTTGRSSVAGNLQTGTYNGSYTATYNNVDTITSIGTVGAMSRTVFVKVNALPPSVRAAATVNGPVRSRGRMTLDGRTYNSDGAVVSQNGIFGVSAAGKVRQSGHSQIGGNGYAPSRPANPNSYEQNVQHFASTAPWNLLGVSQAWFNLNVPLRVGLPPAGFNGIWYTQTPPVHGRSNLNKVQGILIVHNAKDTAALRNVHGTFEGLLITDRIRGLASDAKIYGALVVTTQRHTYLGNGKGLIAYSPQILSALGNLIGGQTGLWKKAVAAGTWQEQSGGATQSSTDSTSRNPDKSKKSRQK